MQPRRLYQRVVISTGLAACVEAGSGDGVVGLLRGERTAENHGGGNTALELWVSKLLPSNRRNGKRLGSLAIPRNGANFGASSDSAISAVAGER